MLTFLHIENIAVIEQANIDLSDGFNVLTGETGAGKSILIDAIGAVLGERTSKELIRAGCDTAQVSAVFSDLQEETKQALTANGFSPDADGNVIIERRLSSSGKGLIKINGIPTTVAVLKEIGTMLVRIHGQHDNQSLLNPEQQFAVLDKLADHEECLARYYAEFRDLNRIRKELRALEMDEDEKRRETELLSYQINELESAAVKYGEIEDLKRKLQIAKEYVTTVTTLSKVRACMTGTDETDGAEVLLTEAAKALDSLKDDHWESTAGQCREAVSLIRDAAAAVDDYLSNTEFSDLDVEQINSRLDLLERLSLKYGKDESEMLNFLENAKTRLQTIRAADDAVNHLSDCLDASTERLIALGEELTASRQKTALRFEKQVTEILMYLNMPQVRFHVELQTGRYTKTGCDTVEFLLSANAGEDLKPLRKVASGGELSRIMLAIQSVLLDCDPVGVMIFDEIDTGISGYTAGKVGIQLQKVAKGCQVICVTHLAQIAAMADRHLLIEKSVREGRSFTDVKPLTREGRIHEIARIMSGTQLTENLYNSAKELLDRSMTNDNL